MSTPKSPGTTNLRQQLMLAIAPFLVAVSLMVLLALDTTRTLAALRAYVVGESLWSSAQKEAARHLEDYAQSGDAADYAGYLDEIGVPLGDRRARIELEKDHPDLQVVREGFRAGRNHPDDIDGLISLFTRFRNDAFLKHALAIWSAGDQQIDEVVKAGESLHSAFNSTPPLPNRASAISAALQRLRAADDNVTPLEVEFSQAMGSASRRASSMMRIGIVILAVILAIVKLLFSRWMLRKHFQVEQALRLSEERFDMAVSGSNDGIWNWGPDIDDLYLSPRAVELLGYPMHDLTRHPSEMMPLVHPEDRETIRQAVDAMFGIEQPLDVEFRFLDWGGNYRWVNVRGGPVRIRGDKIHRVAGSITDITERKKAEAQSRQRAIDEQRRAEEAQIALLEQVQGRIGRELHDDLGQRLTGTAFLAKALEHRLSVSAPGEREQTAWIVKLINEAIDRVRFLSRQLSPIEIDEVSLGTALRRLVDDVHDIFGTRITVRIAAKDMSIPAEHANQLFRIAQESISNALRHGQATHIHVCLDALEHGVRLAVSDNGVGFAVRTRRNSGLGLRNMTIRAQALQGHLRLRSSRRGTIVIVRSGAGAPVGRLGRRARMEFV